MKRREGWWRLAVAGLLVLGAGCVIVDDPADVDASAGDAGTADAMVADAALDADGADAADARRPRIPDAGPPPEDIDGYIEWQMGQGGIPGLAAAILKDGEVTWTGTYGWADVESETPVTEDTLFQVGSISKTITVVPLLRMVEDELVDLEAPASDYLDFTLEHPDHPDGTVTVRMLLTHTSGMQDVWPTLSRVTEDGDPSISLADFAEGYTQPGGEHYTDGVWGPEPLTSRSYCNAAFAVTARLIEVTGRAPFREQTQSAVFAPLGMSSTGWFLEDVDREQLATLYTWNDARRAFVPIDQLGYAHYPAGLLRTSVSDLSRFLRAFMNDGELEGTRILQADTVQGMWEVQWPSLSSRQALVWSWVDLGGHRYVAHSGASIGGSADMLYSPDDGVGILMMTNGDSYVRARLGQTDGRDALQAILARLDEEAHR